MAKPAYKSSRKESRKSRPPRKGGAGRSGVGPSAKNVDQTTPKKRPSSKPSVQEQIPPRVVRTGDRMPETTGMVLRAEPNKDYGLIDSGNGEKLERYGSIIVRRPEGQAIWLPTSPQSNPKSEWAKADAVFTGNTDEEGQGRWQYPKGDLAETWPLEFDGLPYLGRFTSFRHTGVFPEQAVHWRSMDQVIRAARKLGRPVRMLNLFGYTGLASLVAARAGAEVTHVDASKKAVGWAQENQALAGLQDAPIRWICDDAVKFCAREKRRGNTYDVILLDPPAYGRGPKGEVWQLFDHLPYMLDLVRDLQSDKPLLSILTSYAIRASHFALHELVQDVFAGFNGRLESGELVLQQELGGRALSTSMFLQDNCRGSRTLSEAIRPGRVEEITSTSNPRIKSIKALALKKNRENEKLFLAEGMKLVTDALATGWRVRTLIHSKKLFDDEKLKSRVEKLATTVRARGGDVLITNDKILTSITRRGQCSNGCCCD